MLEPVASVHQDVAHQDDFQGLQPPRLFGYRPRTPAGATPSSPSRTVASHGVAAALSGAGAAATAAAVQVGLWVRKNVRRLVTV